MNTPQHEEQLVIRLREYAPMIRNAFDEANPIALIINAHLHIERVLYKRVITELETKIGEVRESSIKKSLRSYRDIVQFSFAIAIIPQEIKAMCHRLGTIRNKIAHHLSFELQEEDFITFINSTPRYLRMSQNHDLQRFYREDLSQKEIEFRAALVHLFFEIQQPLYHESCNHKDFDKFQYEMMAT